MFGTDSGTRTTDSEEVSTECGIETWHNTEECERQNGPEARLATQDDYSVLSDREELPAAKWKD